MCHGSSSWHRGHLANYVSPGSQGKTKKASWQKKVDEGVTQEQAKEQYVELVEKLKTKYGYDENKEPEAVGN
jgi:diazepam-binding inhibitor (GABA receptor modulator, acyl-CoA-binding protein)